MSASNAADIRVGREAFKPVERTLNSIRGSSAWTLEAHLCLASASSKRFIRAQESAKVDSGLLVDNQVKAQMPDDLGPRSTLFLQHHDRPNEKSIIPVEFKSFSFSAAIETVREKWTLQKICVSTIMFRQSQIKLAQAVVIGSLSDPDWVALVPMCLITRLSATGTVKFGSIPTSMVSFNPLPVTLAPFVMPKGMLAEAYESLHANYLAADQKLYNPFSKISYSIPKQIIATTSAAIKATTSEADANTKINLDRIFKGAAQPQEWHLKYPTYFPLTADVHLEHRSGVTIVVELKTSHCHIINAGKTLRHTWRALGRGSPIFTYKAPWDYILTFLDNSTDQALLLCKDDIPRDWWHQDCQGKEYLEHEYPTRQFLDNHTVRFDGTPAQGIRAINRIVKDATTGVDPLPKKASLTSFDIFKFAGPLPSSLLELDDNQHPDGEDLGNDEDLQAVQALLGGVHHEPIMGDNEEGPLGGGDVGGSADNTGEARNLGKTFGKKTAVAVNLRKGTADATVDAHFFLLMMKQCRARGRGCMLDLGKAHPFGRIGMVSWEWTEKEKTLFDTQGKPPTWIGRLGSHVPMITMNVVQTCWRVSHSPPEGTPSNTLRRLQTDGCLMIFQAMPKEISHEMVSRWVIPSEIMLKAHVGTLKSATVMYQAPLYLKNGIHVEQLLVSNEDLHATIYGFLSSSTGVEVGMDKLKFNPAPYLKSVGDYKYSALVNFDTLFRGNANVASEEDGEAEPVDED